jgi:hypothetical protein
MMTVWAVKPTQPTIQWIQVVVSPGVKWPGCEVDHPPPSSTKAKIVEMYLCSPIYLHGIVFKPMDNLTLPFNPLIFS